MRRHFILAALITVITTLSPFAAQAGRIDSDKVWFGVEYTFQDQAMVDEPGRNTMTTPHKQERLGVFSHNLIEELNLPPAVIEKKTSWKPGILLNVPDDGQWVMNTEPVTIEINTTPRTLPQLKETATPIFKAAADSHLVPYVNPGAERSGMGHIHIGAKVMRDNPFYKNPLLLRNVMVYFHKNPALLYGFSEAYDLGHDSNIETYHVENRQRALQAAIEEFDTWYDDATPTQQEDGFNKFLAILNAHDSGDVGFFRHYRFINLESLTKIKTEPFKPDDSGKFTVEFRNFRPPQDADTVEAFATMLTAVLEYQSRPGVKEPFRWVSESEALHFFEATTIEANWRKVRAQLALSNPFLEKQMKETISTVHDHEFKLEQLPEAQIFNAYSEKTRKGSLFEVRLPIVGHGSAPHVQIGEQTLEFSKVTVGLRRYWVAVVDLKKAGVSHDEFVSGRAPVKHQSAKTMRCDLVAQPAA